MGDRGIRLDLIQNPNLSYSKKTIGRGHPPHHPKWMLNMTTLFQNVQRYICDTLIVNTRNKTSANIKEGTITSIKNGDSFISRYP